MFFLCSVLQEKYFPQKIDGEQKQKTSSTQQSYEQGTYDWVKTRSVEKGDKRTGLWRGTDAGEGILEEREQARWALFSVKSRSIDKRQQSETSCPITCVVCSDSACELSLHKESC